MAPMAAMSAGLLADLLGVRSLGPIRVLDIAAGHGLFGITVAKQNSAAEIVALDWPTVLEVAKDNAEAAGVTGRYRTIAGDAMTTDLGRGYDLVLLPNFLHHFDETTCTTFLGRVREAMKQGGRVAALEFVPDENRVTPPIAASFSITMLAMTPSGDAYTFSQYQRMFTDAGFLGVDLHAMPPAFQRVVTARR
jgi:cyclopropane fatty-acyl-phospholipid synthase-like methyltransferase